MRTSSPTCTGGRILLHISSKRKTIATASTLGAAEGVRDLTGQRAIHVANRRKKRGNGVLVAIFLKCERQRTRCGSAFDGVSTNPTVSGGPFWRAVRRQSVGNFKRGSE